MPTLTLAFAIKKAATDRSEANDRLPLRDTCFDPGFLNSDLRLDAIFSTALTLALKGTERLVLRNFEPLENNLGAAIAAVECVCLGAGPATEAIS